MRVPATNVILDRREVYFDRVQDVENVERMSAGSMDLLRLWLCANRDKLVTNVSELDEGR